MVSPPWLRRWTLIRGLRRTKTGGLQCARAGKPNYKENKIGDMAEVNSSCQATKGA